MAILPLFILLISMSLSPTLAKTDSCSTFKFSNSQTFTECTTLPYLKSSLHWTYKPTTGSLSLAFIAPPASPDGWIAWAINPDSAKMIGAQTLAAFKQSNGSMTVKTYNITSYKSIQESKILYETSDLSAESGSDGNMILFATMKIGEGVKSVNQVYQVGSSVTNGVPDKHAFKPDNLETGAKLDLTSTVAEGPALGPSADRAVAGGPDAPSVGTPSAPGASIGSAVGMRSLNGLKSVLFVFLLGCLIG
ncbi:hypothetical protein LUZ60_015699 [Juncus effusus]|nr:hypothetical protein LUZ60_015699 [Juncus effusus]